MNRRQRTALLHARFMAAYGEAPTVWVQAPGRVDLMGSHTDYNQGHVLTMTIDRDTWIVARPRRDRQIRISSLNVDSGATFELDNLTRHGGAPWTNYVKGVAAVCQAQGLPLQGFDGLVHSTVPFSSGLSSSAALEVATATIFSVLGHWTIEPVRLALLCQQAENEFVGVNCGVLDQYTSALGQAGHAVLLDCRDLTSRAAGIDASVTIVICDTRARRQLSGSEYPERRAQCAHGAAILRCRYPTVRALRDVSAVQLDACAGELPEIIMKRCRFIVEEEQRVATLATALEANDWSSVATLTAASYLGARDLYQIGTDHMESMMHAMRGGPGVIGARQAGAGFGGCMVAFVDTVHVPAFMRHVERAYLASTNTSPSVFPVQPAPGAGPLYV